MSFDFKRTLGRMLSHKPYAENASRQFPSPWHALLDPVAVLIICLFAGLMAWLSVRRYVAYNANMFDLGNMAQAIWSVTQGRPLEFTYSTGNLSRLALHVELIYFLFAPLYHIWPTPKTLLIAQAILYASGAIPVYALTHRSLQSRVTARLATIAYLAYPVAQTAVLFDFHGDTLAMPLLLFALDALDDDSMPRYWLCLLLALSCKLYIAAPVCALGTVLVTQRRRRVGIWTVAMSLCWGSVMFWGIRPLFRPAQVLQSSAQGYLAFYFGGFWRDLVSSLGVRLLAIAPVLLPAIIAVFAPLWLIPASVIIIPVFASNGPGPSFSYLNAHYASAVPFLIVGIIKGIERIGEDSRRLSSHLGSQSSTLMMGCTVLLVLVAGRAFLPTPLTARFWTTDGAFLDEQAYGIAARDNFKSQWLDTHISDSDALVASSFLAPHLINRPTLYLFEYPDGSKIDLNHVLGEVRWVVADALADGSFGYGDTMTRNQHVICQLMEDSRFQLIAMWDGLVVFDKNMISQFALQQSVTPVKPPDGTVIAQIHDLVRLHSFQVDRIGRRKLRLAFVWSAEGAVADPAAVFAVTRLEGVDNGRIYHLCSDLMWSESGLPSGLAVSQVFEVEAPPHVTPGTYRLLVGWYDGRNPWAFKTDDRARIGQEVVLGIVTLD